ncbi:hypothetical protein INP77_00465 [Methylophilus sp. 13]|uniref:hypothetical protein n=1 Tax=Methylophilus sp. 13 TaxID=2781018 RepID=UPI00188F9062|nr:hypothetical protein [Methylophilus sp. 13]MBF5037954.1 hypothetical protein [Methylophilus sp. 13]
MARDDFKKPVIQLLKSRVSARCSNPDCRVPTVGPSSKRKVNNIGIAAHITAAAVGGPRHDPSLSVEERIAFENGIWLCRNCAGKIDSDVDFYTVRLLNEWKLSAEQLAKDELGNKIPDQKSVDSSLKSAFTGMPTGFFPQAISNIHKATSSSLEALDPRFDVKSNYIDGLTTFSFEAKQDVSLSMHISAKESEAFLKFVEEGTDLTMDSSSAQIEGSKLLIELSKQAGGQLSFTSPKTKVLQKVWLKNADTDEIENFYDINGEFSVGTKALTFEGYACDGILKFTLKIFDPASSVESKFSLAINHEKWIGLEINTLPYFERIHSFFTKLNEGWKFYTSIERNGEIAVQSVGQDLSKFEFVYLSRNFLDYTSYCRTIASKLSVNVQYNPAVKFTRDEIKKLWDVADTFLGKVSYTRDQLTSKITCQMIIDENSNHLIAMQNSDKPTGIQTIQEEPEIIKLFDKEVTLPILRMTFLNIFPKFDANLSGLQPGDVIDIEWVPDELFTCMHEYILDGQQ